MRIFTFGLPDDIGEAIIQEAAHRVPPVSISRVLVETIVPAFQERADAIKTSASSPKKGTGK